MLFSILKILNLISLYFFPRSRHTFITSQYFTINNGNCTEWSAIWSEVKRVITKSHDREAEVRSQRPNLVVYFGSVLEVANL